MRATRLIEKLHHKTILPCLLTLLLPPITLTATSSTISAQNLASSDLFDTVTYASASEPPGMPMRAPLVFPAAGRHTATVIFFHGLGDTGHGWSSAVENWRRRQRLDEVKFVLPHAPSIPITMVSSDTWSVESIRKCALTGDQNWGMRMPGWFDIVRIANPGQTHSRFF
jgi:hypothetical protein